MGFFPWLDSANGGDGETRWTAAGGGVTAGFSPSGRAAYPMSTNPAHQRLLSIPDSETVLVGWKGYTNDLNQDGSGNAQIFQIRSDNGSTLHLTLTYSSDGVVHVRRGGGNGTLLASSDHAVIFVNTWHDYEVMAKLGDSDGRVQVWIDGAKVIDFTGDTKNGGTKTHIDTVRWARTANGTHWICDIVVDNTDTPKGPTMVLDSYPSADGASTDLTPSGEGDNYEMVNENPPDGDTTYVSGDTEGQKDTYALDSPVPEGYEVLAVQVSHYSRKADPGARFARPVIRSNGTDYVGESVPIAESYMTYRESWVEDPATSQPWTRDGRNGIEVGVEIRDS